MKKSQIMGLALGVALLSAPAWAADGVIDGGEQIALQCFGCHGTDGKNDGSIPSIAGKSEAYHKQRMLEFKNNQREETVMTRHAKGYSDAQIDALAKYLATLKK